MGLEQATVTVSDSRIPDLEIQLGYTDALPACLFDSEISGFRMVNDDCVGRLLRLQHEFFRHSDADAFGLEQNEELRVVFQVPARRIFPT